MRKSLLLTATISFIIFLNVKAQFVNIPDTVFRNFLRQNYPASINAQGQLDTTSSVVLSTLSFSINIYSGPDRVHDLTGLQYFKNLTYLDISLNCCLEVVPVIPSLKTIVALYTPVKLSWLPNGLKVLNMNPSDNSYQNLTPPFINDTGHLPDSLEIFDCGSVFTGGYLPPLPPGLRYLDISANIPTQVDTLPPLPATLKHINLRNAVLSRMPALPASLTYFNWSAEPPAPGVTLPPLPPLLDTFEFSQRLMGSLPAMPASLQYFSCWGTDTTTTFPVVPEGLKIFKYNYAPRLRSMPVLPNSITDITCFEVGLTNLISLPASLKKLVFNLDTALHYLPPLPAGLQHLECYSNRLWELPDLPSTLKWLACNDNQLTYLPLLPDGLLVLYCNSNRIQALKQIPPSLTYLNIVNNQLNCLPHFPVPTMPVNLGVFADPSIQCISSSNPYLQYYQGISSDTVRLPECNPVNNINHCETHPVISGYIFYDRNNNGIKDPGEDGKSNVKVGLSPGNNFCFSDDNGHYEISTDSLGSCTITPTPWTYFFDFVPMSAGFNFSTYDTIVYKDFALVPNTTLDSPSINITCINIPRPGFPLAYYIVYENTGTTTLVNPVLTLHYNGTRLVFDSSSVAVNQNANDLIVNLSNMAPLERGAFTVWFRITPETPLGDSLLATATIAANSQSAVSSSTVIVRGAYDPNDKQATPQLSPSQVANGEFIDYTIRFQNTGTDTAFTVVISDTLNDDLQAGTLEMIASSHNCKTTVKDNVIFFEFLNILLPDSNTNEPLSHGFVSFKIKPQPSVAVNTTIPNRAAIYFDYNAPVITNTATTLIKEFTVVPLKLIAFSAVPQNDNTVLLNWNTANEINTKQFVIERGNDGLHFSAVTTVLAKGRETNYYNVAVADVFTGIVFYRLQMMDIDGTFSYSPIIKIDKRKNAVGFSMLTNPVNNFLIINTTERSLHNTQASIINMQGAVVKTYIMKQGSQTIEVKELPKGIYYIRTATGSARFIIQ